MSSNSSSSLIPAPVGSPTLTVLITIILLVLFFIGFFSVCFYRCFMEGVIQNWHLRQNSSNLVNPTTSKENSGLDSSLIQLFPTFIYSSVKDLRREQFGLECAICLAEFSDDDLLRLLTVCYHVFHQECIDLWLESHKTCPVCRRDLDLPKETLEHNWTEDGDMDITHDAIESNTTSIEHEVSIHIREESGDEGCVEGGLTHDDSKRHEKMVEISRSHSTGHSVVTREEEDRYTLRLMDHVKVKITGGHCKSGSCITFTNNSTPMNGGYGESSEWSRVDINTV